MAKIPDFTKLTEKLDLKSISDTVKSIVNPGSVIPEDVEGDPIAAQLVEISKLAEKISETQVQQADDIANLRNKVNAIFHYLKEHAEAPESEQAASAPTQTQTQTKSAASADETTDKPAEPEEKPAEKSE